MLAVQKFCIFQLCLSFVEARHCSVLRFRRPYQQDGVFVGSGCRCVLMDVWFGGRLKMFPQHLKSDEDGVSLKDFRRCIAAFSDGLFVGLQSPVGMQAAEEHVDADKGEGGDEEADNRPPGQYFSTPADNQPQVQPCGVV